MSALPSGNNSKISVILINMGGPRSLADVRSFMYNLFNDRHIMKMPQPFRALVAQAIVSLRTPDIKHHYELIGSGSPLMKWTARQAEMVEKSLKGKYPNLTVGEAYSYIKPTIKEAVIASRHNRAEEIICVPLYPHYSCTTLGSVYSDLEEVRNKMVLGDRLKITPPFYEHPPYIKGTIELLAESLQKIDQTQPFHVLFSAHALPQSFIDKGDPYRAQIVKTVDLILREKPLANHSLSFQSKIGPVAWMKPSTLETVRQLGRRGVRQLVVMPIGFVCDHIETLYELDIELAAIAGEAGIEKFVRGAVFNDHPSFISLLTSLIEEVI